MQHLKLASNPLLFAAIALILFAAITVPASAAELTVGTRGQFKTIQQAVDAANPGDTVLIAPGTYTENVVVNKPLTITAVGVSPTVRAADASKNVFRLTSSGVRIDGLTIAGGASGVLIQDTSNCVVTNIVARDNARAVYLSQSKQNEISNSDLAGNGYGVYSDYSSSNTISSNVATGEKGTSNALGDGIYLTHSDSNMIMQNNLSANHDFGLSLYVSHKNIVSNNTISDNERVGIRIGPEANNNTFTFNTFARNGQQPPAIQALVTQPSGQDFPSSGILIVGATGNWIYLNSFIGQPSAIIGASAAILTSKEKMVYTYNGVEQTGYMSNYYSDYKGTDTSGTGIGSTPSAYGDKYPLVRSGGSYGQPIPASAVTPTPSLTAAATVTATAGDQRASVINLPWLDVVYIVEGFIIIVLVLFGWKYLAK